MAARSSELRPSDPEQIKLRLIGDWKTPKGSFRIRENVMGVPQYFENQHHGVLHCFDGSWFEAEIRDGVRGDAIVGFLRLRSEQKSIYLQFKKTSEEAWGDVEEIHARPAFEVYKQQQGVQKAAESQRMHMQQAARLGA